VNLGKLMITVVCMPVIMYPAALVIQ
jgi:hypothetical protein